MPVVYFLNFLAEFEKCIIDKRAGSRMKWEARWIKNQQAWAGILGNATSLHFSGLLLPFPRSTKSLWLLQLSGGS